MKPRFRAEWVVVSEEFVDFGKLSTESETSEQKFSLVDDVMFT